MDNYEKLLINKNISIKEALKKIDKGAQKIVFVVDNKKRLMGSVSDGDIRRWILQNGELNEKIIKVLNKNPKFVYEGYSSENIKEKIEDYGIEIVPVVNEEKIIVDIISWDNIFINDEKDYKQIVLPVVIMAGGKGTRLDPFTRILPKPLIPIENKAMIEIIMDEYAKFGMKEFYISINHKGRMIRAYFEEHDSDYSFQYITEDKPLGTAGALKYLEGKINRPFFVTNCDILIEDDYSKIYDFHENNGYALTLVGSMQHHTIPYGVCEIENGGLLKNIKEKPEQDFLVNTGMYILNPDVLKYIPENEFYHITSLIEKIKDEGMKVGVYPVSEKSWVDVGQWDKYDKSIGKLN